MKFDPVAIEMSQLDAAVAAVVLAEYASRQALKALLKDTKAVCGGSTNAEERAMAESCSRASRMLSAALMKEDRGLQSAYAFKQSVESMAAATFVATEVACAESAGESA